MCSMGFGKCVLESIVTFHAVSTFVPLKIGLGKGELRVPLCQLLCYLSAHVAVKRGAKR